MTTIAIQRPPDRARFFVSALLAVAFILLAFFAARFTAARAAAPGNEVPVVPCRQCNGCACPRLAGSTLCGCPR